MPQFIGKNNEPFPCPVLGCRSCKNFTFCFSVIFSIDETGARITLISVLDSDLISVEAIALISLKILIKCV